MDYKVDYHIHTYYSDGIYKPTDIVRRYSDMEYDIIAITDHDGIDGVQEAMIAGEALRIKVVPGIEFGASMDFDGENLEVHLLGYNIDIENEALLERLKDIRQKRHDRNLRLLEQLNRLGYELSYDDLLQRPKQTYVGKPNFQRALKAKGYDIPNMWELFDTVPKERIDIIEAIKLVKGAGGTPVLAHPMQIKKIGTAGSEEFWTNIELLIKTLKKAGLSGIECYHPSAEEKDAGRLVALAGKYHLHITEGSDFHTDK